MSKTVYSHHELDYETGELKTSTWVRSKKLNTDNFVKTYLQDIGALAKCSKAEMSIVLCCLQYVDWDTNEILLTSQRRKDLCDCGGLTFNTINVSIPRLIKKNIFIKHEGKLMLNPNLFFFGTDLGRTKVYELKLRYELE
jgi:hypothetical protein